jgi:hypothetical protein
MASTNQTELDTWNLLTRLQKHEANVLWFMTEARVVGCRKWRMPPDVGDMTGAFAKEPEPRSGSTTIICRRIWPQHKTNLGIATRDQTHRGSDGRCPHCLGQHPIKPTHASSAHLMSRIDSVETSA